jgi:hypothetical protein
MPAKRETERELTSETETNITRKNAPTRTSEGPEAQRSAGSLKEALYGNADAEAKAQSDMENTAAEARKEAAQAELDAQQADRDAGFATSAEEGPAKTKVVDPETGEVTAAEDNPAT